MIRPLRALLTGSAFLAIALGSAVGGWIVLPLWLLLSPRAQHAERRQRLAAAAYRLFLGYLRVCRLVQFTPPPLPPALPPGPCVIVANHPSLLDVVVILVTMPWVRCMVNPAWIGHPLMARLIRAGGHFPGPARRADASLGDEPQLPALLDAQLAERAAVLIFPEGTRSPEGGLRRFRKGAAEAALRAGVPLVPLRVRCEPSTLRKGQPWYDVPDRIIALSLEFLPPLDPADYPDAAAMTRALRARYEPSPAEPPPPDVARTPADREPAQ